MRIIFGAILIVLVSAFGCHKGDFRVSDYQPSPAHAELRAALDTCVLTGSAINLAREFMEEYPDDVAVQVLALSLRYDLSNAEQIAYYRERATRHPENEIAQYLAGRVTYSPSDGRIYAEDMLSKNPDSYWGHLLLGRSFTWKEDLTDGEFAQAERALKRAIALDNSLPFAIESLGYLYALRNDTTRADQTYAKLSAMDPKPFEHVRLRLQLWPDDAERNKRLLDNYLKKNPDNFTAIATKAALHYDRREWKELRKTLTQGIAVKRDSVFAYDMACSYGAEQQLDSALVWLTHAIEWGYGDVDNANDDPDLETVRNDPRWDELKSRMAEQRTLQIAEMSKREVAEARIQRANWAALGLPDAAPDFTLFSLDSTTIKLAGLRGKVVVLDFWATWCYWCHKSSPLIDEFFATADTHRVAVYGVNVMERFADARALQAFLMQRGVHFPTVLGNDDLVSRYKVVGLPSIFVIDPQGKLAYRAFGYSPALGETLKAISAELLKTNERPAVMEGPAS